MIATNPINKGKNIDNIENIDLYRGILFLQNIKGYKTIPIIKWKH